MVNWEWFAMCFGGVPAAALRGGCKAKRLSLSGITINMPVSLSFVSVIVSWSISLRPTAH